jgi:hypothetical protein
MRKKIIAFAMLLSAGLLQAADKHIFSPDGKLVVTVSAENGAAVYSVNYNGKVFLNKSPLGVKFNDADFTQGLTFLENVKSRLVDESYELANIKQKKVHYVANEGIVSFVKGKGDTMNVVFQVSNNDIAFKYTFPSRSKDPRSVLVQSESTGFVFPAGTTTFICPMNKAMTGFGGTNPSYETNYVADDAMGKNGQGEGYSFPCLFKVSTGGWVLVSETGVDSRYCASRLIGQPEGLYSIGFPQANEMNGYGSVSPAIAIPGETPWRTITLGETLAPIVETTIPFNVVKPRYEASQKYKYTKGSWSWIIGMDRATTFDVQKQYIDFSAAIGWNTILVDALWDTQIGYEKIAELAKYGASKNVDLYLWYNSNGVWNAAPQGPRGIMDNTIARRKEMAWMKSIGVKGIKVDFFGSEKQEMMRVYEDILYDANDYGIMVIFHGCTLPRGWERMYPNYAASEAVRASENLSFSQSECDREAFNACFHPFIRNTVGSMDFGGSTLNKVYNLSDNGRGSRRVTSDVYACATAVLFQSGVQHFALSPINLKNATPWALDFMKTVPTTWDEVKFIDGYPGKYIVMARRSGDKWYIAGINGQKELLKVKVKLPMIKAGDTYKLYSDDAQLVGKITDVKMRKKQDIELTIPVNGASLIVY